MKVNQYLNILILGLVLNFSGNLSAAVLKGKIKSEEGRFLSQYKVTINGRDFKVEDKQYQLQVNDSQFYQVKVEAEGYYPSYQTFSNYELHSLANSTNPAEFLIPDILLTKKKSGRVLFAFGGDVMMGRRYSSPNFEEPVLIRDQHKQQDTQAIVQFVKPYMELADYAAVNFESIVSDSQPISKAKKSVNFYSPPETLDALKWAGIDYVTLGNNHIYDYLDEGLASTLTHLKTSQLDYSGAGKNKSEAIKPHREQLNGEPYSMLGFVGWTGSFRPHQAATSDKGGAALGSMENIKSSVANESSQSNHVIVQYHGSLEYSDEPSAMTESRLKAAIDHGADLVIAHHPHVTQGLDIYKGKLIAYSMGNFIFDQYFPSTPHSYILYVWMDGDNFHRAEVVPIYIKGYVPIAATGQQRNTLLKRTQTLTQRRGLNFSRSGGHLILESGKHSENTQKTLLKFAANEKTQSLYQFPVTGAVQQVTANSDGNRYRLGQNQLNGGDFETFNAFSSAERGWMFSNARVSERHSVNGNNAVEFQLSDDSAALLGMKVFRRVYKAGNPMTFTAKIFNTEKQVKAKLLFQRRKSRDKFKQALANNKMELLKEIIIQPGNDWQTIEFDFDTPRVGYRSYRVLLQLEYAESEQQTSLVYVDDVSLIEWQPHFNEFGVLPRDKTVLGLATHLGLEKPADSALKVIVTH